MNRPGQSLEPRTPLPPCRSTRCAGAFPRAEDGCTQSSVSPGEAAGSPGRQDRTKPRLQSAKGWKGGAEHLCRPAGAWCAGRPLNPRPCRGLHAAASPRLLGYTRTVVHCNSTDRLWKAVFQNWSCEDVSTYISCAPRPFCDNEKQVFSKIVATLSVVAEVGVQFRSRR
jgi:hypothetical protein